MEDDTTDDMKYVMEGADKETKKVLLVANGLGYRRGYKEGRSHHIEFNR